MKTEPTWPFVANMILWIVVAAIFFILSGCSTITSLWQKGAEANDSALYAAQKVVCEGASIGSVKRRYGGTASQAREYNAFCGNDGKVISK